MTDALRKQAEEIAHLAGELAEYLSEVDDDLPALPVVLGLVDLEDVGARLARTADALLVHVEPRAAQHKPGG